MGAKKKKEMAGVNLTNCLQPTYGKGFPMVKEKCGTLLMAQVDAYGNMTECSTALMNAHPRLKNACNNQNGGGGAPGISFGFAEGGGDFSLAEGGTTSWLYPVVALGVGLGIGFLVGRYFAK